MSIEHTQVDDALKGKNVGTDLLTTAVEYARSKHMKIVPQCSFTRSVFEGKKEFSDVLQQQ